MATITRPAALPEGAKLLLTPAEVAAQFAVTADAVAKWRRQGKIRFVRTPGGHARYFAHEVRDLLGTGAR